MSKTTGPYRVPSVLITAPTNGSCETDGSVRVELLVVGDATGNAHIFFADPGESSDLTKLSASSHPTGETEVIPISGAGLYHKDSLSVKKSGSSAQCASKHPDALNLMRVWLEVEEGTSTDMNFLFAEEGT